MGVQWLLDRLADSGEVATLASLWSLHDFLRDGATEKRRPPRAHYFAVALSPLTRIGLCVSLSKERKKETCVCERCFFLLQKQRRRKKRALSREKTSALLAGFGQARMVSCRARKTARTGRRGSPQRPTTDHDLRNSVLNFDTEYVVDECRGENQIESSNVRARVTVAVPPEH